MVGILKNPLPDRNGESEEPESISEFRKQVYKNTQLNAKLTSKAQNNGKSTSKANAASPKRPVVPRDTLSLKHQHDTLSQAEEEKLKWNQQNLAENDIAKLEYKDINIDEPKTPYQGAVDPTGEYYRDDDDELESLSLGEPVVEMPQSDSDNSSSSGPSDAEPSAEESAEAKHRRFEELRKKHYNVKEALKAQRQNLDDEELEDED
ncbi:PP1-complex regulatory subunit GLC8 [Lachancea thermotolerans CBS 6340]|uniref:KLTH0B09614p n=1 Tax=Lachancea thermotolerans (strain ATCC 56472 / CBS 6340 / NRRL Y-8284) TaxID=559295 RepID=C5DDA6_LACTC|nr:KLTH0B09614p [Lachancea thermotolerans CBS 6340]CAR21767.1 KLTH0B09614p [Lachancea thermotolerans CBS 6340]